MAYAAKAASAFYGPFREAADSAPGVRRPAGLPDGPGERAARRCARRRSTSRRAPTSCWSSRPSRLDLSWPPRALRYDLPVAAYQVSGEYAMIAAAAERGWIDGRRAMTRERHRDRPGRRGHRHHLRRGGRRDVDRRGAGVSAASRCSSSVLALAIDPAWRGRAADDAPADARPRRPALGRGRRRGATCRRPDAHLLDVGLEPGVDLLLWRIGAVRGRAGMAAARLLRQRASAAG